MAATPSGKDKLLRHARVFVGGYDLSGDARTFGSLDNEYNEVEITGWSESVMNFLSEARVMAGVRQFQAITNDTTGRSYAVLKGGNLAYPVSILFGGGGEPAVPDPAYLLASVQMSDTAGFDGGVGVISADFLPRAGESNGKPMGVTLANSALTASTNGASHDNEASSADGYHANIHITASSGGAWAFKIQHSTDDSAWSDLASFTVTGDTVEAEHISGTGTVNRYVRFVSTRTSGTVTAVCAFARN